MSVQLTIVSALLRVMRRRRARAPYEELKARNLPEPPAGVAAAHDVERLVVEGARAVWLDKSRADAGVIVYMHGGSYVTGPVKQQWEWFARLCAGAGVAGLLIDYRLTPEYAFPAGLDDALTVIAHVQPALRGGGWLLAGDSAGGGLALAIAYRLRNEHRPMPGGLILSSPWLDVTMSNPKVRASESMDAVLTLRTLERGSGAYARGHDPRNPLISPLYGDPAGLPPIIVHTGNREMMVWDIRDWHEKCIQAGVEITYVEQPGGFHGYPMVVAFLPEARRALAQQIDFTRTVLARES